jgi:hypothetical protein
MVIGDPANELKRFCQLPEVVAVNTEASEKGTDILERRWVGEGGARP